MSVVARTGRTSSSVKKARLEAERSKLVGRMDECDQKEEKKTKYDCVYKLVIMGDTRVGKTWLLNRILGQEVPCKDYQPTFIANFHTRTTAIDGAIVKLEIWDISGGDKFSHIGLMFYPGSSPGGTHWTPAWPGTPCWWTWTWVRVDQQSFLLDANQIYQMKERFMRWMPRHKLQRLEPDGLRCQL